MTNRAELNVMIRVGEDKGRVTHRPGRTKEDFMSKEEMKDYITDKLEDADNLETEMVYGLVLGLMGE